MKLLGLTPEEHACLVAPLTAGDGFALHLQHALTNTLCARLRCTVQIEPVAAQTPDIAPAAPLWQVDAALAALWLARRLGGHYDGGRAPFVPRQLLVTLDAALAERWLDAPQAAELPGALAWRIAADTMEAGVGLQLPRSARAMTAWARQAIGGRIA